VPQVPKIHPLPPSSLRPLSSTPPRSSKGSSQKAQPVLMRAGEASRASHPVSMLTAVWPWARHSSLWQPNHPWGPCQEGKLIPTGPVFQGTHALLHNSLRELTAPGSHVKLGRPRG